MKLGLRWNQVTMRLFYVSVMFFCAVVCAAQHKPAPGQAKPQSGTQKPAGTSAPTAASSESNNAGSQTRATEAAPSQNVEVLELGPEAGGFAKISFTPDYRQIAIVGPNGSRMSGYFDGKAGEKYDQIPTVPPVISADGRHWAYAARKSADWFMVVDGKEYGPYIGFPPNQPGISSNNQPVKFRMTPNNSMVFSPDGKHWAFVGQKGNQGDVVIEDGKEIASGHIDTTASLLFSKQGDHLVFVSRDMASRTSVVLDGMQGPKYEAIGHPQFSEDGHHLIYVAGTKPGKYTLVVDGKEGLVFDGIGTDVIGRGVLISPDGSHIVYPARNNGNGGGSSNVVVDGKVVYSAGANYSSGVWMSPSGKTIAYLHGAQGGVSLIVNGKPGLEYATFEDIRFAPDEHVIYTVRAAQTSKMFVIDGDKESDPYDQVDLSTLHFSADGKHPAYVASADSKSFVVLDGKKFNALHAVERPTGYSMEDAFEKMLQMTPDGHVVYHGGVYGNNKLVKDDQVLGDDGVVSPDGRRVAAVKTSDSGASTATAQLTLDGKTGPLFRMITKMVFSPDSKHFAYVGLRTVANGSESASSLIVDGVDKGEYPEIADLQFSPDSQHLFHFTTSHINGGPGVAYMDQRHFFTFYWLPGYFNLWLDDHRTMQIVGGKDDKKLYRVRYFLPGANHTQQSATISGPDTVDVAETKRMIGNGAVSALSSSTAAPSSDSHPSVATASGSPGSNTGATSSAQIGLAPGTSIEVRLTDRIDSSRDPAGKQYQATVTRSVDAGNGITIQPGAAATVTLVRNSSGWGAQLSALIIDGRSVSVTSASVEVSGGAQNTAATAANAVNSVAGVFGRRANAASAAATMATGARVLLPPGVKLTFVLGGA